MKRICIIPCGKRKFGINIQTTDRWKQKMCILVRSEKHVRRTQLCFRKLGYIIGETWILRPNDIVLENYDLAFDSKSDEVINIEQLQNRW